MANQNSILSSNDFETLDSLDRNADTALFSGDTDAVSTSVSRTTPKLASSIHKHARLANDEERRTKKGYYFCKYCEPSDPQGHYPSTRGLKLHLKREHNIDWTTAENESRTTLRD
jgi:hypothetical protein